MRLPPSWLGPGLGNGPAGGTANAATDVEGLFAEAAVNATLAQRLIETPNLMPADGIEGEATILFADLRGFTGMSENRRPVEVLRLVNRCMAVLVECVHDEAGLLDKFLGDGLMAVFGLPFARERHTDRAVRSARAMQRAMAELGPVLESEGWERVGIGIGLETGRVVAGNVGIPDRQDYTVLGDVVNVASRLTAGAAAGEVVLGPNAGARVRDKESLVALGSISIRGRRQPVEAFRVRLDDPELDPEPDAVAVSAAGGEGLAPSPDEDVEGLTSER